MFVSSKLLLHLDYTFAHRHKYYDESTFREKILLSNITFYSFTTTSSFFLSFPHKKWNFFCQKFWTGKDGIKMKTENLKF